MTNEELFETSIRPSYITDFVKGNIDDIDRDLRGDMFELERFFKSEFISLRVDFLPIDIIKFYMPYKKNLRDKLDGNDHSSITEAETLLENFLDNRDFSFNQNELHLAIIREAKDGIFLDSCLCVPRIIIGKLQSPTVYTCKKCGYTEAVINELPDMMYTIENNRVEYYCKECIDSNVKVVHVGDSFSNPYQEH